MEDVVEPRPVARQQRVVEVQLLPHGGQRLLRHSVGTEHRSGRIAREQGREEEGQDRDGTEGGDEVDELPSYSLHPPHPDHGLLSPGSTKENRATAEPDAINWPAIPSTTRGMADEPRRGRVRRVQPCSNRRPSPREGSAGRSAAPDRR